MLGRNAPLVLAAVILTASCTIEEFGIQSGGTRVTLVADGETRTSFLEDGDAVQPRWLAKDRLVVCESVDGSFGLECETGSAETTDEGRTASFELILPPGELSGSEYTYTAAYPSDAFTRTSGTRYGFCIPSRQSCLGGALGSDILIGQPIARDVRPQEDEEIHCCFKRVGGTLRLEFNGIPNGEKIGCAVVTAPVDICGGAQVDLLTSYVNGWGTAPTSSRLVLDTDGQSGNVLWCRTMPAELEAGSKLDFFVDTDGASYEKSIILDHDVILQDGGLTRLDIDLKDCRTPKNLLSLTASMISTSAPMQYVSSLKDADSAGMGGSPDWANALSTSMATARKAKYGLEENMWDGSAATCFSTNMDIWESGKTWTVRPSGPVADHNITISLPSPAKSLKLYLQNPDKHVYFLKDKGFRILASSDGKDFSEVPGSPFHMDGDAGASITLGSIVNDGNPIKAIRIKANGESKGGKEGSWTGNGAAFGIAEMKIWASGVSDGQGGDEEEDIDYESIDFENKNVDYNVYVFKDGAWKSIEVHSALCSNSKNNSRIWNDWNNSKGLRDRMAFALFEHPFDGPVKVRVQKRSGTFAVAKVRPTDYGIPVTDLGNGTIEFTLPSLDCRKVSVEFDSDRQHNLFIIGMQPDPDKPDKETPGVKYYGPGEHDVESISLFEGETLYIDYGAVVYAKVWAEGKNCTIAGHGILSGEKLPHKGNTYSTGSILIDVNPDSMNGMTDFTIKDITMIDSPSWNLRICKMDDVKVDGINMISWILNGDGVDICGCTNTEVCNCFLRNYDDCITLKHNNNDYLHDMHHVHIHDNLIWNDYARGIVVGPEHGIGRGGIRDILIEDCTILQSTAGAATDDVRCAFTIYQWAWGWEWQSGFTATPAKNITARNITFDNIASDGRAVYIRQHPKMASTTTLSNVLLENFRILDGNHSKYPAVLIDADKHKIVDMTIRDLTKDGNKITSVGPEIVVKGNVDLTIE